MKSQEGVANVCIRLRSTVCPFLGGAREVGPSLSSFARSGTLRVCECLAREAVCPVLLSAHVVNVC